MYTGEWKLSRATRQYSYIIIVFTIHYYTGSVHTGALDDDASDGRETLLQVSLYTYGIIITILLRRLYNTRMSL